MISNNSNQLNEFIIPDSNTKDYYKNIVIGQQVYSVLLYYYIFSDICQDITHCCNLVKWIPQESLLKSYIDTYYNDNIWSSNSNGIKQKIRISYVILGLSYQKYGFDKTYLDFKNSISKTVLEFIKFPVDSFNLLLSKSTMHYFNYNINYQVRILNKFSSKDVLYCAKAIVNRKEYIDFGYSKKNAIEKISHKIFFEIFTSEQIQQIAKFSNIESITPHQFKTNILNYTEKDTAIVNFSDNYNIEYLLTRFTLLTRSQMGKNIWDNIGVSISDFIDNANISHLKRSMIYLGQEIILLEALIYQFDSDNFKSFDVSSIDSTSVDISPYEVRDRIQSILSIEKFCSYFCEKISPPVTNSLSDKDKYRLSANFATSFFLSNFSPNIKFADYFKDIFKQFYSEQFQIDFNYRYFLISFFSAFNIRIDTNHYEIGNGIFHAEIKIGRTLHSPVFIYEHESMRYAKKYIWQLAYEELILAFNNFFSDHTSNFNKSNIIFLIKTITLSNISNLDLLRNIGILDADNYNNYELENVLEIIIRASNLYNDKNEFDKFLSAFDKINNDKYVINNNYIYQYKNVLHNFFNFEKLDSCRIPIDKKNIGKIYDKIVNPTSFINHYLIESDYKLVSKIKNIDDETAKFALDCSLDAYNYLPRTSSIIEEYYKTKSTPNVSKDIGQIICNASNNVKTYIFDSHSSVSDQLIELTKDMDITRMIFACGYCFASGLNMMMEIFKRTIHKGIPVEFYIGSLQSYDSESSDNIITSIDKTTCKILNEFLNNSNFTLYTCKERFYHGKFYFFESNDKTIICLGSSNISRSAFISNYELNIAFLTTSNSEIKLGFESWINQLHAYSTQINEIDESLVGDNEIKMDGNVTIKQIASSVIQKRINELTNSELQYRLNLWMSYMPDIIAEDLGVLSLPNYIVFVYNEYKLLVLESFSAGNSYFCIFFNDSFEDVINKISTLTKSEIFEFSQMKKRGYHISNKFTLEKTIKNYFRKDK